MPDSIRSLSGLQKNILRRVVVEHPDRPPGFSFGWLYGRLEIARYAEDEVRAALDALDRKGFLNKEKDESGDYRLSREQYLEAKSHYRWAVRGKRLSSQLKHAWGFLWRHFLLTAILAIITSAVTAYITVRLTMRLDQGRGSSPRPTGTQPVGGG